MSFVNALLTCIPLGSDVTVQVLCGRMEILDNVDAKCFAVRGLVESLFGVGERLGLVHYLIISEAFP